MYTEFASWLDSVLQNDIPEDAVAFCFNIYDDGEGDWSVELVATGSFDQTDDDWPCDEIADFGTREEPFAWNSDTDSEHIHFEIDSILRRYLDEGNCANLLTSLEAVAFGFVDGDLDVIYTK